jgi:hypothetical protein
LHQAEPDQGLEAGHENTPLAEVVFIVEFDVAQRHEPRSPKGQFALTDPILPEGRQCKEI